MSRPRIRRLEEALARSRKQLAKLKARLGGLPEHSQAEIAPLIDAYLHMLGPSRLMRGDPARVQDGLMAAEAAVHDEAEAQAAAILALAEPDRAGRQRRAEEVREIARRLVRNLTRQPFRSFPSLAQGSILAATDLRPADAALIQPTRFAGIITAEGGADGHTAVMLRALGLPAVLGATGVLHAVQPRHARDHRWRCGRDHPQPHRGQPGGRARPSSPPSPARASAWPGCSACPRKPRDGTCDRTAGQSGTAVRTADDRGNPARTASACCAANSSS